MEEQYELGKYLGARYSKIIGNKFAYSKVRLQSLDVDRNLMSAQCTAAGMFEPSASEMFDPDLKWQPVAVHMLPLEEDYLLYILANCQNYDDLVVKCFKSQEVRLTLEEHKDFIKSLEINSGKKISNPIDILILFDILTIEDRRGFVYVLSEIYSFFKY